MSKVRINDLARELEIKSRVLLEYLPEIGISDKRSHSSAIEEEEAEKVRNHFRALDQPPSEELASPAPPPPSPVTPPAAALPGASAALHAEAEDAKRRIDAKKLVEAFHPELHPVSKTLEEIKAAA